MSDNLPEKKLKTYFITNDNGTWEEVDELGNTIRIQKSKTFEPEISEDKRWIEIQDPRNPQKVILVDRRLPHDEYKNILLGRKGMPFSQDIADVICDKITSGDTLSNICKDPSMPSYSIINRWRLEVPEFEERITKSFSIRADTYADEVMDIANETTDDTLNVNKLRIDQRKWRASIDNNKYSARASALTSDGSGNILINITTGVSESEYAKKAAQRKLSETGEVIDIKKEGPVGE